MALSSRSFRTTTDSFQVSRKWKEREVSPERTRVWAEPKTKTTGKRRVPVVYYLYRNGQLDHPHFMEVPISSNDGLYLRDVINRLNDLRGKGMASLYSWSSKRSYKNGFVWHDLSENDFVYPAHGQEYVLKGSEILDPCLVENPRNLLETSSFRAPGSQESHNGEEADSPVITRRRNQSWSSIDLSEYKVFKPAESSSDSTRRLAADASTQTDDRRRRRKPHRDQEAGESSRVKSPQPAYENQSTELSGDEISPPPSDSSPETLESLMKADGRLILCPSEGNEGHSNRTAESGLPSGRMKASAILMQLISCGTMSFRDCGSTSLVKNQGLALVEPSKTGVLCIAGNSLDAKKELGGFMGVKLEGKEYFSGSLIETKKEVLPSLKRSSSYSAERIRGLELMEKETNEEGVRANCMPGKPKAATVKPALDNATLACPTPN